MIKAGLIGATGLSGIELVRLLHEHPEVEFSLLSSQTYSREKIADIYPHLLGKVDIQLTDLDMDEMVSKSDVIFVALPHGHSADIIKKARGADRKVIDLGADYRFDDLNVYESWYETEHNGSELLSEAAYGLPEANRQLIKESRIIANPGCYPTSAVLALMPALRNNLIEIEDIIIDSKSGVSGAGRKLDVDFLYSTCNESVGAYKIASHRHTPEIEQELSKIAGEPVSLLFTPHLIPMTRGILTTAYAKIKDSCSSEEAREIYGKAYENEPFVNLLESGVWPRTKWVSGSNNCYVNIQLDEKSGRLIVVSVIDNLIKGAAGQAIQNMNLVFGFDEESGLKNTAIYP